MVYVCVVYPKVAKANRLFLTPVILWQNFTEKFVKYLSLKPGNTHSRGRLGTVDLLLIRVACLVSMVN
jgi:hypothetical protein